MKKEINLIEKVYILIINRKNSIKKFILTFIIISSIKLEYYIQLFNGLKFHHHYLYYVKFFN